MVERCEMSFRQLKKLQSTPVETSKLSVFRAYFGTLSAENNAIAGLLDQAYRLIVSRSFPFTFQSFGGYEIFILVQCD